MPVLVTLDTKTEIASNADAFYQEISVMQLGTEPCLYGLHVCAFKYMETRFKKQCLSYRQFCALQSKRPCTSAWSSLTGQHDSM